MARTRNTRCRPHCRNGMESLFPRRRNTGCAMVIAKTVAPVVRRIEASATTAVPIAIWVILGPFLIGTFFPAAEEVVRGWGMSPFVAVALISSASVLWLVIDGGLARATYGMRKRRLVFARSDGQNTTFAFCSLRILTGVLLLPLIPVSIVLVARDAQRRSIPDRLCGTVVRVEATEPADCCAKCGYCLCGLKKQRCPECGTAFSVDRRDARQGN